VFLVSTRLVALGRKRIQFWVHSLDDTSVLTDVM
jgi:hypothetical protein